MNKGIAITLITLLSLITISLIVGLVVLLKNNFKFNNFSISNVSEKLIDEKKIETIKDLDIETNIADVKIEESNRNNIKVELYSETADVYSITEEDNQIKVVLKDKKRNMVFFRKISAAKIYVPVGYSKNIKVTSTAGDIKVKKLPNATLTVKADVGDVKVESIDKANIDLRIGDLKINNINELTSSMKTGDLKIINVKNITSKLTTGDIKINTVTNSLNLTGTTGDVKIENANIKQNSQIINTTGDVKIGYTSGCYVEASTNVGDVKVNNKDRKSNIILTITNKVGDIKVNY